MLPNNKEMYISLECEGSNNALKSKERCLLFLYLAEQTKYW